LGSKVALPRYKSKELVQNKKKCKIQYRTLLRKIDGTLSEFRPNGVDTGDAVSLDISRAQSAFPLVAQKLACPGGPIDILVGMDHMDEAPREHRRAPGLALFKSVLGLRKHGHGRRIKPGEFRKRSGQSTGL
jgi:hypothetical protein